MIPYTVEPSNCQLRQGTMEGNQGAPVHGLPSKAALNRSSFMSIFCRIAVSNLDLMERNLSLMSSSPIGEFSASFRAPLNLDLAFKAKGPRLPLS